MSEETSREVLIAQREEALVWLGLMNSSFALKQSQCADLELEQQRLKALVAELWGWLGVLLDGNE